MSLNINNPIGVFDSGIGGLSVLRQFIRFLPYERYIYLGDTARVPYGNKSSETVQKYSAECAEFLLSNEVKLIIVACNTASSVALNIVKEISNVPVIGMIYPAARAALQETKNGRIGIIGTRATINSDAYAKAIYELKNNNDIKVFSQACPLFVPLVEEGWIRHQATRIIAEEYLEDLKKENIDTLILGCTHYPLLAQLISEIIPGVSLIDSGEHSAVMAIRILGEQKALAIEKKEIIDKPSIDFYVTDIPSTFYDVASSFLGFEVQSPKVIKLGK